MLTMVRDVEIHVNFMVLGLRRKVCVEQLQVKTKVVPQQVSVLSNVSNYKQKQSLSSTTSNMDCQLLHQKLVQKSQ